MAASVKILQNHGFQGMGGVIVGFDSDPVSIFRSQINFIQKTGIVTAMVGILMAPPETKLWYRLKKEGRLLPGGTGDNTDGTTNLFPKMKFDVLVNGYNQILESIYSPKQYYERIATFLKEYRPSRNLASSIKLGAGELVTLIRATFILGFKDKASRHYWKLIFSSLLKYPCQIGLCVTLAVQGLHFRKVYENVREIRIDDALLAQQKQVLEG